MDSDSRVDLFLSFHGPEKLSAGFTTRELAYETEKVVRSSHNNLGIEPSTFFESTSLQRQEDIVGAVSQTLPGGLAFFLLTPAFFQQPACIFELRAFLEVCSDPNVSVKLLFACLDSSADDILSIPLVKRLVPTLSQFKLQETIYVTSIEETSARLSDAVFSAWECSDGDISPHNLPTIYGRTRKESFFALQRLFTSDDLPLFCSMLDLGLNATNMLDAFSMASDMGIVTPYNVNKLYEVNRNRSSPSARSRGHRMIEAYERKWIVSNVLGWRDKILEKLLRPDSFKPYFAKPPQPGNLFLDFESLDENLNPVTVEGLLLRNVLELAIIDGGHSVSAIGKRRGAAHGMGGVGKTTALQALCYEDQVKQAYPDGIWFLEFGEDADDRKVIKEVARCMLRSGGVTVAQEMTHEIRPLSEVLEKGAEWLRDRTVLLVFDDLWGNENQFGYLPDLSKLLLHAPKSKLVISTRDRNIAKSAGVSVHFAPLFAYGTKARKILLANTEGRVDISDEVAENGIRRILRICAGLPVALAIAGRGLEEYVRNSSTTSNGISLYCEHLEKDSECITIEELERYPGLVKVIESSLGMCQKWGTSDEAVQLYGRKLDMISMFKGLCVLEKRCAIPKQALSHVWGLDDKCTYEVMMTFANFNLASLVETGFSTQPESEIRLHDLVLELCQQMAVHESTKWHKKIVEAYGKKLSGDRNFEDREQGEQSRSWWDTFDDGYIFAHLSRHLALSGQSRELELVLCDIRWTMLRLKSGEWTSLLVDFERLFRHGEHVGSFMRRLQEFLKVSWSYAREKHDLLAFYIFAHFTREKREERDIASFLSSIDHHFPKLWLRTPTRCIAIRDRREVWKEVFSDSVQHLTVDWTSGNVFAVNDKYIFSWRTNEQRILWKKSSMGRVIALNKVGNVILSVSTDNAIRRWDAHSGAPMGDALLGLGRHLYSVAISDDGNVIGSYSSDGTIRRWDAQSGALIDGLPIVHESAVHCVAMSNDGNVIVSGSQGKMLQRWDAQNGAPIGYPLIGHADSVTCIAMSSDGSVIVSGSRDGTIGRWDAQNWAPIGDPLIGHEGPVNSIAVNEDGSIIVSGSLDQTMRRWDCGSVTSTVNPLRGRESIVTVVAVCNDVILSGSWDGTIRLWNAQDGTPIGGALIGHVKPVRGVAVSDDGKVIVSCSSDGTIRRWDAQSGAPIGRPFIGHKSAVLCFAMSNDGNVIVSGSRDKTVRVWDAQTGAQIGDPLIGHKSAVVCVAMSNDRKLIVSGSRDTAVRRWQAQSGAPIGRPLIGHKGYVKCIAVSNDGKFIASGSSDETIRIWDAQSGAPIGDPLRGHDNSVDYVSFSDDENLIVSVSRDDTMRCWGCSALRSGEVPAYELNRSLNVPTNRTCLAIDFERKHFVFGLKNGSIAICNLIE